MSLRQLPKTALTIALGSIPALMGLGRSLALTLVEDGKPTSTIVISKEASEKVIGAASELQIYLQKMSGAKVPIKHDDEELEGRLILVGRSQLTDELGIEIEEVYPGSESILMRSVGDTLVLAGNDAGTFMGTQNAVYTFLDSLGVRWFFPDEVGEVVPAKRTIRLGGLDVYEKPDYLHRNLWYSAPSRFMSFEERGKYTLWWRRNRLGGLPAHFDYAFGYLFPPEEYFENHPEYYALVDGKRSPDGQICTTNPDVIQLTVEKARDYFDKNPDAVMFSLSPNDGYGWCESERCTELDPPEFRGTGRGKGRRLLIFVNQVAEELHKTHPEKFVAFYAYAGSGTIEPPGEVEAEPNVIVAVAHHSFCHAHPVEDPGCKANSQFRSMLEAWDRASKHTYIREYYGRWSLPWPTASVVAEDIGYFHRMGAEGLSAEVEANGEGAMIALWIAARLMWASRTSVDDLLDDFYSKFYGESSGAMRRYFQALEEAFRGAKVPVGGSPHWAPSIYTPEVLEACWQHLEEAEEAARSDLVRRRIEISKAQMRFTEGYLRVVDQYLKYEATGREEDLLKARAAVKEVSELIDTVDGQIFLVKPIFEARVKPYFQWLDQQSERTEELLKTKVVIAPMPRRWRFKFDPNNMGEEEGWYRPGYDDSYWDMIDTFTFWESQFGHYDGYAWYRASVEIPGEYRGRRIWLYFGALDEGGWIYINGRLVNIRPFIPPDGWREAFEVGITRAVRFGEENLIAVKVLDRSGAGGIWKPVKVIADRKD